MSTSLAGEEWDTDERGFPAALTEPAENSSSRVEGRMDLPIRRLDTLQRTLQLPLTVVNKGENQIPPNPTGLLSWK